MAGRRPVVVANWVKELLLVIAKAGWLVKIMTRMEITAPITNGTINIKPLLPKLFPNMMRASGESIQQRAQLADVRYDRAMVGSCN